MEKSMISSRVDNQTSRSKSGPDWVFDAPWGQNCEFKSKSRYFRKTGTPLEIYRYLWVYGNSWVRIFLPLRYALASTNRREQVDNKGENVKCKDEGSDLFDQHLIASQIGTETYPIPEQRLRPSSRKF